MNTVMDKYISLTPSNLKREKTSWDTVIAKPPTVQNKQNTLFQSTRVLDQEPTKAIFDSITYKNEDSFVNGNRKAKIKLKTIQEGRPLKIKENSNLQMKDLKIKKALNKKVYSHSPKRVKVKKFDPYSTEQ